MGSNIAGAGCSPSAILRATEPGSPSVHWHERIYIAALSTFLFLFLGFRQWRSRDDRVLILNMNIRLPLFWSTWSRTRGPDSATCAGLVYGLDCSDCTASEQSDNKCLALVFPWIIENTRKQGPMVRVSQPSPPRLWQTVPGDEDDWCRSDRFWRELRRKLEGEGSSRWLWRTAGRPAKAPGQGKAGTASFEKKNVSFRENALRAERPLLKVPLACSALASFYDQLLLSDYEPQQAAKLANLQTFADFHNPSIVAIRTTILLLWAEFWTTHSLILRPLCAEICYLTYKNVKSEQ